MPEKLLLLHATTHFKYAAPKFVKLKGEFQWAFELEQISVTTTRLTDRWLGWGEPRMYTLFFVKPGVWLIDHFNQPAILRGIKRRVEGVDIHQPISAA